MLALIGVRLFLLLLFVVLHLLETEEIFTRLFVELAINPVNSPLNFRDHDVLERVNTSVGDLEGLIQDQELSL